MVATDQFCQEVDLCGFAGDQFDEARLISELETTHLSIRSYNLRLGS
jgi:hypothetical protein